MVKRVSKASGSRWNGAVKGAIKAKKEKKEEPLSKK